MSNKIIYSLVNKESISLIRFLLRPWTLLLFLNSSLTYTLLVLSRGKLINNESTSKDAWYKKAPWLQIQIILANSKDPFRDSLNMRYHNKDTKFFAHLLVPVLRQTK